MDKLQFSGEQERKTVVGWLQVIRDYYHETGNLRPEDLAQLLGDQSKPVQMRCEAEDSVTNGVRPLFG